MESKVVFYHSETCPSCAAVEMMLKKKGIEYTSCTNIEEMKARGVMHIPTVGLPVPPEEQQEGQQEEKHEKLLSGPSLSQWLRGV